MTSGGVGGLMLARQTRGDAEAGEPDAAACDVHQDVGRLDVLVDQPAQVHLADCGRERDRDAQELRHIHRLAEQLIERLAAGVLEHQRHAAVVAGQGYRPDSPLGIQFGLEVMFMFEPLERLTRGVFPDGLDQQDRVQAVARAAVECELASPQRREYIARKLRHKGLLSAPFGTQHPPLVQ